MRTRQLLLENLPTLDDEVYLLCPIDPPLDGIDTEVTQPDYPEHKDRIAIPNETTATIGSKVLAYAEFTASVCEIALILGAMGLKDKLDKAAMKAAAKKEERQKTKARQQADLKAQQEKWYFTKKDQKYERKTGRKSPRRK